MNRTELTDEEIEKYSMEERIKKLENTLEKLVRYTVLQTDVINVMHKYLEPICASQYIQEFENLTEDFKIKEKTFNRDEKINEILN